MEVHGRRCQPTITQTREPKGRKRVVQYKQTVTATHGRTCGGVEGSFGRTSSAFRSEMMKRCSDLAHLLANGNENGCPLHIGGLADEVRAGARGWPDHDYYYT